MVSLAFRNTTDEVFWEQFGPTLKEGVGADYDNKDTLTSLLLFPSSHDAAQLTTLPAYVDRMPPDQTEIFYITGESRHTVEHSPHLEAFKAKHYEVLFLLDPVDELDENVKEVRLSTRLTESPVCLVGAEHDYSPQLERLLRQSDLHGPKQRRIMELNPTHPILGKMQEQFDRDPESPVLDDYAQLLLGYGLLAEESELHDPVKFTQLVAELMVKGL